VQSDRAQNWTATNGYQLALNGGTMCVDNYGSGTANGNKIVLWQCTPGNPAQEWIHELNGEYFNPQTRKVPG